MTNKVTNKEYFGVLSAIVSTVGIPAEVETSLTPEEILEWIDTRVEQLSKRATTPSKAEKAKQEQNAKYGDAAVAFMEANAGTAYTASELIREIPELDAISTQKLSPILKKAALEGRIVKIKTSKTTKWGVGIEVEETE